MKPHELLDPAFRSFLTPGAEPWTLDTLPAIRKRVHATFKSSGQARCENVWTTAYDGERLRLCLYKPDVAAERKIFPVILYIHGGGFVLGQPEMADDYLANLAEELGAIIVAVDYRLAPEHPFPIPLDYSSCTPVGQQVYLPVTVSQHRIISLALMFSRWKIVGIAKPS